MLDDGLERARKLHFVNARDYPFPDALLSVGAKRVVRSMLLALNNELRHRTLLDINAERVHSGSEGGGVDGDMAAGQQMLGQQSNDSVSESVSTQTLSSSTLNPSTLTTTTTTTDIVKAASTSINRNPLIFSPSSTTGPPSLSQVMVQSLADIFIHSAREIHNNNIQNDNNYSIEFGFPSLGRRGTTPTLTKQGSTSTKPYTTFKLGELSSSVGFRSLKGLSWLSSSPSTSSTSSSGSSQSKNKSSSTSTHLLSTSTTLSANSTDIYSPDSTSRLINEMDMKIEPTAISFTYGKKLYNSSLPTFFFIYLTLK